MDESTCLQPLFSTLLTSYRQARVRFFREGALRAALKEPRSMREVRCPACDQVFAWRDVTPLFSFPCPLCKRDLRVSETYARVVSCISLALSAALSYAVGARWIVWILAWFGGWIPILIIVMLLARKVITPGLEIDRPSGHVTLRDLDD